MRLRASAWSRPALRATPGVVAGKINPASAQADIEWTCRTLAPFQGLEEAVARKRGLIKAVAPPPASEDGVSREERRAAGVPHPHA